MVYLVYIVFFFALGFCLGWMFVKAKSHTLDDYNQTYSHLTCQIISRMQQAMRSMGMEQDDIDRVIDRMGCKIMPTSVLTPPPTPPEKPAKKRDFDKDPYTLDEVVMRLSPKDRNGNGEWFCYKQHPYKAWRLDKVGSDGKILQCSEQDLHSLDITPINDPYYEDVYKLAEDFIRFGGRFLFDFDRSWWKLYEM